ncbi:HalD/BesD family halogenase [Ruegeria sp. SCP11]|uniref:HalD/BesD family halogenase n=1 Tax=Ruegeria sp. SCP11 TaxID=3141378 RepID=UPI0033381475
MEIADIVDFERFPLGSENFGAKARASLDEFGALVLEDFIRPEALSSMQAEAKARQDQAYFCTQSHSVYLTPTDPAFDASHPANRRVQSSKGCVCDDVVSPTSPLRILYNAPSFRSFIKQATGETELHPYADPLSSINIHYATRGQELGWHFDNSSFAITLLIQKPDAGGRFEYVKDLRDAGTGDMNYDGVRAVLDSEMKPQVLSMDPGTLVLFRGRNSIHRVSPNESDITRMLAVLAYNAEPGVALSENARMTFYGRLN